MGKDGQIKTIYLRLLAAVLFLCLGGMYALDAQAFVKRKEKSNVYEVPTTGKILEVTYRPEFDEWWVHCREGDSIAVYTLDPKSQSWGRVLFTPKKIEDKAQPAEKTKEPDKTKLPEPPPEKIEAPKVEKKEPEKDVKPGKTWWDPLHLIKPAEKKKE
jgi:hypothetical protein